ncbi:MAG: ROK family protein [bacterium]|nr:ROK family protein [bacterium]
MADIVFDIGGTNMRVALRNADGSIGEVLSAPTPQEREKGLEQLVSLCRSCAKEESIARIAGGIAGVVSVPSSILHRSPNLPGWEGLNFTKELGERIGATVLVRNDAMLGGLGEARRGAGRGYSIVAYLAVGTGVGGARIVDGVLDEFSFGFEPGHQIICHKEGKTLENLVGGRGVEARFGTKPGLLADKEAWKDISKIFAQGVYNTILHWSPHVVVLAGSMITDKNGILIDLVQEEVSRLLRVFPSSPVIARAELGGLSVLVGASEYVSLSKTNSRLGVDN